MYFGARYYDSEVSVWLSVDPLSDKCPTTSPYMYTAGNPVMLVDPNGMETIARMDEWEIDEETKTVTRTGDKGGKDMQYISFSSDGKDQSSFIDYNKSYFVQGYKNDGYTVIDNSEESYSSSTSSNKESNEPNTNVNNNMFFFTGLSFGISSELMFSNKFKTWMGKDFKFRSQNWGGNGRTGGKYKFARSYSRTIRGFGYGLGVLNYYYINQAYKSGNIGNYDRWSGNISNTISTFGGIYGAAWSIGWEGGRLLTNTNGYQTWKTNTWLPLRERMFNY